MLHDTKLPPITYLNKAQIYPLSIVDARQPVSNDIVRYRTCIRVTFEDYEQSSKPAASWALWKDTRGHEAYQKDGNLYAIELVGLFQENQARISLDGFCVTWYSDPTTGRRGCLMGVRFHFLSTDFSHTKGVKGAPIKLCAKTETVGSSPSEISCCKVKLFREHGAERKMFNDVSQLKRAIERRRHDYVKAKSGGSHLGKRKRGSRFVLNKSEKELEEERREQLQKSLDDELAMMQNRFNSNRPVTNFCLPGSEKDDPDLFPMKMVDEETQKIGNSDQPNLQVMTPPSTSRSASRNLPLNPADHRTPRSQKDPITPIPPWPTGQPGVKPTNSNPKVPVLTSAKQVACFYLRFQKSDAQQDIYHTAIYLTERTTTELIAKISHKQRFSQAHIVQLFHVKNGMKIIIDDDVVQRIPDGQDMIAEVSEISSNRATGGGSTIEVSLDF
ncbi:hypothetical protein N7508_011066 [Penicillium antarcticum]|uniref:uncharacterized protein n=1 Tax=Penicillium antarcticum TaxID=416450 RepID=UPI0023A503A0|nr:uncharacterized protein N7508_011066 [Penicillium antarcticum]KAJ5288291.1 hypothetical protein N7508_011066 [Penicillium antarcticum]